MGCAAQISVEIDPLAEPDVPAWQRYVMSHPGGTVFHLPAWSQAVHEAYGHLPAHLGAWSEGRLVGVLPMFLVESLFVGRVLVSVPYATYGGVLADRPEAAAALVERARGLCRELKANYLELRHRDESGIDGPTVGRYDTFRKDLPSRVQDVLAELPKKTRAAARKGLDLLGEDCAEVSPRLLKVVYDLYAFTLRRLGSPNYSRRLFQALQRRFGVDCVCLVVRDGGAPVAGVVSFVFRDEIVPYFSGSLPQGMEKRANNIMYLRLMEYAVRRGLRTFDFNRTRRDNAGPYDFKRHHGFVPQPLHYQIFLTNGNGHAPDLSPGNSKFALAGRVWRRLPLWLTRPAGAYVTRWIP